MAANFPVSFEITNDGCPASGGSSREVAELVLAPFSRIPKLEFDDVEVGREVAQKVNLRNPTGAPLSVVVIPPKDFLARGFSMNADEFEIPPHSKGEFEIRFKPVKELQCRDTIYFQDKFQNQKFHFQLTSRAISKKMTVKRKRWNMNKKPVVVPTFEQNIQIKSLPPNSPVTAPVITMNEVGGSKSSTLNVTFPVVSVAGGGTSEIDGTYCRKPEPIREMSAVFDDSLELDTAQGMNEIRRQAQFSFKNDSFTFESVELNNEVNKENAVRAGDDRLQLEISFSDIGFDSFTPVQSVNRTNKLRSIENITNNTSTPKLPPSNITTKTNNFPPVSTIKPAVSTHIDRDGSSGAKPLCNDRLPIKLEPVTPKLQSSRKPMTANVKIEPTTPQSSQVDPVSAFKVPQAACFKEELFTPIPRSESMKKCAISFAVSPPPVGNQSNRRKNLFGRASTPCMEKPVVGPHNVQVSQMGQFVKQEAEGSILPRSWNVNVPDSLGSLPKLSAQPKRPARGETLSPKSLVAFKKSVRVHVSRKNLSRPSSAKSDPSSPPSERVVVDDVYTPGPIFNMNLYSTMMSDPFARCAVHPLEYLEKRGKELIKWVNSVLTPPVEYSAYEAGVDVANLWKKSVASDNVPLPPSRETVSSKFHKNEIHLLNLRKTAKLIFRSACISETLYKIYSKIDVGYISLKDDIDLHYDQGARCHLVQLLMYYNPLWLRIGLETIYDRSIPLHPRQTVIGLMHFIKNNLLSDKYICEKNSYQNIHHLKMPKFKKEMNDFIVFKFFSLVFFLDIAKRKAIIPYDPCLFNKNSPIKESEGMINEFIKEFTKCVGHMKKNLATMGFVLSHKQTAIDEYDFAVQTHLDLRDGANLTRLIEIILQKKQLIKKLRLPAISRLQKVHNAKLAFNAMLEEGVTIVDVLPSDVVDGHREKIMSLLWQILHKFLKPRMEKGAITIQAWWRTVYLKLVIHRRVQLKKHQVAVTAAVKIQSLWRGYLLRKNFPAMKTDLKLRNLQCKLRKECAATTIQRWYRATIAMQNQKMAYETKRRAALTIQQRCRPVVHGRKQRNDYLLMKESAITIQRRYRATLAMKKQKMEYEKIRQAAVTIQRHYRALVDGRKQRKEYLLMKESAITTQRWYRATVAMKKQKMEYGKIRQAAVTIQRHYRALVDGRKQRNDYLLMKESAIRIQRWCRATVAMKNQKMKYEKIRQAAVTIQRHYRALVDGRKQRNAYLLMKESAITTQRWYRATVAMKKQKMEYGKIRQAAVTIQRHYRALVDGRKQRNDYLLMKESAITIQRWYRATVAMKNQNMKYEKIRQAAVTIQRHYRALVDGRKQRNDYLLMKESAITIQRWYRATVAMKKQKMEYEKIRQAAVTIQRHYRAFVDGRKQRNDYLLMKESAITIQRRYRAAVTMKKQKKKYEKIRQAAVTIQRRYRESVDGRKQRNDYLLMKESAITIQRRYRAAVAMKNQKMKYKEIRRAAVTIQRRYRALVDGRKQRNDYLLMKESSTRIQCWYRATVAMKKQKIEYEKIRQAAVTIQRHYRALVDGRKQRNDYLLMKESAITIQRRYRAAVAMKNQKMKYEEIRQAAVTIQRHYRAFVDGKKQRNDYLLMKASVITIQRRYRAAVAMKNQKMKYEEIRQAAVTIQHHYRALVDGRKQRNDYLLMKESVITIQRRYRAAVAMKKQKMKYEEIRHAAVTIQHHYRALVDGRKQRNDYLLMKESAITIQRRYRAAVAMKNQKMKYKEIRQAAVTIQRRYRASVDGRKQRNDYLLIKESAITIQRRYRATVAMKNQKMKYKEIRQAAVTIQRRYRALVDGRKQRNDYLLMKESAITIQRRYRATVAMKNQKMKYKEIRQAAVTIQRRYRALVDGRKQRNNYLLMKESAITIQRRYRATVAMKKQKMNYENIRQAAVTIQRHYKALGDGRKERDDYYLLMEKSAVRIQVWYRAAIAMKNQKMKYQKIRQAAITIQQRYRAIVHGRKLLNDYLLMKESAVRIQCWYRATVAMKKQKMAYETKRRAALTIQQWVRVTVYGRKQRNTYLLMKESAVKIQRWYRAIKIRTLHISNPEAAAEASEGARARRLPTLRQNYDFAIEIMMSSAVRKSLNRTYVAFKNLDFITLHSPVLCEKLAEPSNAKVYAVIYYFLDIESRSNAYQIIFGHGMNVLLQLITYHKTYNAVWENTIKYDGINSLLHLQGKFLEKNEELFCRAATILWLLSRSQDQVETIRSTTEFVRRMTYYSKKLLSTTKNPPTKKRKPVLPNLKSNWGYSHGVKGYKEFPTRIDAVTALVNLYDLKV